MIVLFSLIIGLVLLGLIYLQQPIFGKSASGKRLERMKASRHYRDGKFQNLRFTPSLTEGYSMPGVLFDFMFRKVPNKIPAKALPSVQTDVKNLPADSNLLVWFGHSSYYLQVEGLKILVDPVFSGNASPIPGTTRAFAGANGYGVDDMPELDYLLISHDHYDHLDYATVKALRSKVKKVVTGLGVGAHLEHWGYLPEQLMEMDWEESIELEKGIRLHALPARHFSGRTFSRNTTLWLSFLLETAEKKIFLGGDSGYDTHFAEIGHRFGPIDWAILENGQYNLAWQAIHCLPEEVLKAACDLKAKQVIPVHSSKFSLAPHSWDEPLREVSRLNKNYGINLQTPRIGEPVYLNQQEPMYSAWWLEL
ncbi:MBL fold metallo-hydrolase [Flavihumibacter sp. CACIAM 22H1]|uniref:MBL fold metallo-hydrolase n=1 Tax=Flavihumibacter sp. CACIAM 22H1 TaxID=1812911 RepID=UPI0007A85844|nr:MBL fold metallo-hydrolase [Flavihumibacter sp. CACIAM 22H1]KYP16334.1 MAG: MBL fold metallo-hydrolase [Flavihumibacter sp. CACIAM 22H1]